MQEPTPPAPGRRWITLALIASLGLNLAVAGLVAGLAFRGPPGPGGRDIGLGRYGHALPEPYRRDLGRALRETRRDWVGPREALLAQQTAFAATLTAEPFDADAAAAVLRAERTAVGTLADDATKLLLAQIARMTPDERRAYAEAILRPPGRDR